MNNPTQQQAQMYSENRIKITKQIDYALIWGLYLFIVHINREISISIINIIILAQHNRFIIMSRIFNIYLHVYIL